MITRNMMALIFACAILVWDAIPATAGGNAKPNPKVDIPNAEELIKHCWDISENKRSSLNTTIIREGNLDTALCLEQEVIFHANALIEVTSMTKKDIEVLINNLHDAYGRLYWMMYNENKGCDLSCGTLHSSRHNTQVALLYEKILRDIIALRKEYGV